MRKHRNGNQDKIFLKFMTAHPGLARGFCRGDKAQQEKKWMEIANLLNAAGPPIKEVSGWKKTWIDWKISIRKKLYRKRNMNGTSDGESEDKNELSKIERSINFICDLDKQSEKRDDTGNFINETNDPFPSPILSPKLAPQPSKKRKNDELKQCFLEALTQDSMDNINNDVEIKVEKEDDMDQLFYATSKNYHSIDSSSNSTNSTAKKLKNDIHIKSFFNPKTGNSRHLRDEKRKGFVESIYRIEHRLDALGGKYDKLIDLKKEQIEEMKKDRNERRRHNLEIEKYNDTLLMSL